MEFVFNDGGRAAAGFKGQARDCVCRAIAIATGLPYRQVYDAINLLSKAQKRPKGFESSARKGVAKGITRAYLEQLGWKWTPTMKIGQGCSVHLDPAELPKGTIILQLSRHVATVIDGVLHDTYDCSRGATRCVYGYWSKP